MQSTYYYKLPAENIYKDVAKIDKAYKVNIEGVDMIIYPRVYPSDKFRTTRFILKNLRRKLKDKNLCDMGCGPGIIGLYALANGATKVVQVDINPYAVKNAKDNALLNKYFEDRIEIIESNCFDQIKFQIFDIIVWNMPFHSDDVQVVDPLERAFYDPQFSSIKKFLSQIPDYSNKKTEIFIAFSNKGNCLELQKIFKEHGFDWTLWKIANKNQKYDNRIYSLKFFI